jgi:hypothetical protein
MKRFAIGMVALGSLALAGRDVGGVAARAATATRRSFPRQSQSSSRLDPRSPPRLVKPEVSGKAASRRVHEQATRQVNGSLWRKAAVHTQTACRD